MRRIHIINPAAGKGRAADFGGAEHSVYATRSVGDAERFAYEACLENPDTYFVVFGGDGTLNEVVNGVMRAGAGKRARLSVVPAGTGNDFARFLGRFPAGDEATCDLISYNDRYAVNMINIGFDCDVVTKTAEYKRLPLVSGSLAYILGVGNILLHRLGRRMTVRLTLADGSVETLDRELLLIFAANGGYCGGGFFSAPAAKVDDGLLDVMTVNKVTRRVFLSLVGDYRKGTHIDSKTLEPVEKFSGTIEYRKCGALEISGIGRLCADGEVETAESVRIGVVPSAVTFIVLPTGGDKG